MLIYSLRCCIVILLALLSVLSVVMAIGKCSAPVPKHFVTSSCKCLTFNRKDGTSKLTTERCDSSDQNQWIQVTKIGKTEAVFHNMQNNRFICYDVCRAKFLLVDREELEDDPIKARLRRKLNRFLREEEKILRDMVKVTQDQDHTPTSGVKDLENLIERRASYEEGYSFVLRKSRGKGYRPKRGRRRNRKKKKRKNASRELKRKQRKLTRIQERIQATKELLQAEEDLSLCKQDALLIKSATGGHQRRVRHCSKRPTRESLVCTLHEVMHATGENTIYADVSGGSKAYMTVKHGRIRSFRKPGSDRTPKGEFLHVSIGYGMC